MGSYRRTCSCCGDYIDKKQMDFLIETGQADAEGNHCSQCYYDINRDNHKQMLEIFQKIEDSLTTPIRKFKWKYRTFEEKVGFVMQCMDKGIITWQINK